MSTITYVFVEIFGGKKLHYLEVWMMQTKISFGVDCISDGEAASVMWFLENSFGAECKKKGFR